MKQFMAGIAAATVLAAGTVLGAAAPAPRVGTPFLDHEALAAAREHEKDFQMSDAELFDQLTSSAGDQYTASQAHWAINHL